MYKVEWNKDHTWKITKYYKNDKLKKFNYYGDWFSASTDNSCCQLHPPKGGCLTLPH